MPFLKWINLLLKCFLYLFLHPTTRTRVIINEFRNVVRPKRLLLARNFRVFVLDLNLKLNHYSVRYIYIYIYVFAKLLKFLLWNFLFAALLQNTRQTQREYLGLIERAKRERIRSGKFAKFTDYANFYRQVLWNFLQAKLTESIKPFQNLFARLLLSPSTLWNRNRKSLETSRSSTLHEQSCTTK